MKCTNRCPHLGAHVTTTRKTARATLICAIDNRVTYAGGYCPHYENEKQLYRDFERWN